MLDSLVRAVADLPTVVLWRPGRRPARMGDAAARRCHRAGRARPARTGELADGRRRPSIRSRRGGSRADEGTVRRRDGPGAPRRGQPRLPGRALPLAEARIDVVPIGLRAVLGARIDALPAGAGSASHRWSGSRSTPTIEALLERTIEPVLFERLANGTGRPGRAARCLAVPPPAHHDVAYAALLGTRRRCAGWLTMRRPAPPRSGSCRPASLVRDARASGRPTRRPAAAIVEATSGWPPISVRVSGVRGAGSWSSMAASAVRGPRAGPQD